MSFNDNDSPWGSNKPNNPNNDFYKILKDKQNLFKNHKNNFDNPWNKKFISLAAMALFGLWLSTGVYVVDSGELALVLRFGKPARVSNPGLNYHLPQPFETALTRKVERIEREEVGFRSNNASDNNFMQKNMVSQRDIAEESLMQTGDQNIVDINFVVQWKIRDIKEFVLNVKNPKDTVKSAAESAMREIIGNTEFVEAQTEGRSEVERKTRELLQETLDSYKSGVDVVNLQMLKIDPPQEVIDAFLDVQTARSDKDRERNQAYAYHNDIIPRARGNAQKIIQDAKAYQKEVIARAEGEVSRFNAIYNQYKNAKDVTKKRLYLETMEEILGGMDKIILGKGADKSLVPYLPLPGLK